MRRTVLALATTLATLLLAGGTALAADGIACRDQPDGRCVGTAGDDTITGTRGDETIRGLDGVDVIRGVGGSDTLVGGNGADRIVAAECGLPSGADVFGGRGNDRISIGGDCGNLTVEPAPDGVDCGPGEDVVRGVRRGDRVAANCEQVIRV